MERQRMDFASWAEELSQRTNRSLAGERIFIEEGAEAPSPSVLGDWGLVPAASREEAAYVYPELPEPSPASAEARVSFAAAHMPTSGRVAEALAERGTLAGLRIAVSLIVEPKTAVLAQLLRRAGAEVGIFCHAHECSDDVAAELAREGFIVEADSTWTPDQEREGALRLLDRMRPQIVVDDGANLARLMVMEREGMLEGFLGVSEETTSGVRAFEAMERAGELPFAAVAVNDSALKTYFDNRHGTGETCITTMQSLLGEDCFDEARVAVFGFGPVGEGFAVRARSLGAEVTVVERDPRSALRALYAGFAVAPADAAVADADIVVSATGVRHTLTLPLLESCRDAAAISVIGGIALEVALDDVEDAGGGWEVGDIAPLILPSGKELVLLSEGNGVNYTSGPGNPIEIMDLSFAVQLASIAWIAEQGASLAHKVLRLPEAADIALARTALSVRGIEIDASEAPLVDDWRRTRYRETAGGRR